VDSAGRSPKEGMKECIMIPVKEVNIPDVDAVAELLPQLLIGPSFFPDAMDVSIFF